MKYDKMNDIKSGEIFYSIDENNFSIEELEYLKNGFFLNHCGYEHNVYFYNEEHIPEIFKDKKSAEKFLIKLLNKKIKELKPFKKEKIINEMTYENIKIGDEFYILYNYDFFEVQIIFKIRYINNDEGGIIYFIDKDSYDCDFIETGYNGLERIFFDLNDIKGKIFEELCLKLYKYGIENYKFEEGEILYYIKNFKIHEKKMKQKEIFNGENGFIFKKHAESFLKEMFKKEIEKIDIIR